MEVSGRLRRRKSLQERLGLVCCGSTWGGEPSTMSINDDGDHVDPLTDAVPTPPESNSAPECVFPLPRMNLAAALEAERQSRSAMAVEAEPLTESDHRLPSRISLMRLLEETEEEDVKEGDSVCCVCMGRKKGAAFIPCGHTFCRVCSRELWLNRGSCPLCNRSILEILDIF